MEQLLEKLYKGTFRSYKVFRPSGDMKLHSMSSFKELDINDNKVLTISVYNNNDIKTLLRTTDWEITLKNRRHFLFIDKRDVLEVISINHAGMVLVDLTTEEKTFYARLIHWENLVRNGLTSAL
jgi:hypothetical protein